MDMNEKVQEAGSARAPMIDNLRAVLIVLVVAGHILERIGFPGSKWLYAAIYSFHMPAMVFLSGLFFRRNRTKVWKTTVVPYLVFQVIYLLEAAWEKGGGFRLQFTTPNWILWYLFSLVLWQMITNIIDLPNQGLRAVVAAFLCALGVGFDQNVGYFFSLSRTVAFFPFFLAGAWIRETGWEGFLAFFHKKKPMPVLAGLILPAVITQGLLFWQQERCQQYFFYCAAHYDDAYTLGIRLQIFLTASAAIAALCTVIPKKELPLISYVGRNTMAVYVLHGVILKALKHLGVLKALPGSGQLKLLVLTAAFVLLLSSPPTVALFHKITFQTGKKTEKEADHGR